MAVFTKVSEEDLVTFLQDYDVGALVSYEGIEQGVSNTNYHVFTDKGRYILTLFEDRITADDLPYFFALKKHLAAKGIPCPQGIENNKGRIEGSIKGVAAVLNEFLEGHSLTGAEITADHCRAVGKMLARMHKGAADFAFTRENTLGLAGWKELLAHTMQQANIVEKGLSWFIGEELSYLEENWPEGLPRAAVHTDVFPDNVFFDEKGNVSGVIDFYYSCNELLAYDLAMTINAWCFDDKWELRPDCMKAMLAGYQKERPLTQAEKDNLSLLCRGAAMRILMTRLYDWLFHNPENLVKPKDPKEYIAKLKFHQNAA